MDKLLVMPALWPKSLSYIFTQLCPTGSKAIQEVIGIIDQVPSFRANGRTHFLINNP